MSDLIDRDAAIALPPYDGDGDPAGQFDHHIFVKLADLRALPAVEVGVTPLSFDQREPSFHAAGCVIGMYYIIESDVMIDPFKLERPGWLSIIGFPTLEAAKAAAQADYAARIRSALTVTPAPRCAECDCANGGSDCTWIKTPVPDAGKVQALVDALDQQTSYGERYHYSYVGHSLAESSWHVHLAGFRSEDEASAFLAAALAAMKEGK